MNVEGLNGNYTSLELDESRVLGYYRHICGNGVK